MVTEHDVKLKVGGDIKFIAIVNVKCLSLGLDLDLHVSMVHFLSSMVIENV